MMCCPFQPAGTVKVRRYQENAWYCITPEMADSMGYGTRIWLESVWPTGTGSLVAPGWNCQRPLRFIQLVRTICGRGYSGKGALVSTSAAQRVMSGACCICQARAGARTANKHKPIQSTEREQR